MEPTTADLATWLGTPETPAMAPVLAAAIQWTRDRRGWTPDADLWTDNRTLGTLIYAGLLWLRRGTPQGFDGYDDGTTINGYAFMDAATLVGKEPGFA